MKFVASDVSGAGMPRSGRILITNDSRSITAFHFDGSIRESLASLQSKRVLAHHAYGPVLFDSTAMLTRPVPRGVEQIVREAAVRHGIDARLIAAVARHESGFNARAVSRAGALGMMQLMPETARYLGVTDPFDPRESLFAGARYLRILLDTFGGDLDLTLAAYNAGPGAVERYRGVPPYPETRSYVSAVRASYERSLH